MYCIICHWVSLGGEVFLSHRTLSSEEPKHFCLLGLPGLPHAVALPKKLCLPFPLPTSHRQKPRSKAYRRISCRLLNTSFIPGAVVKGLTDRPHIPVSPHSLGGSPAHRRCLHSPAWPSVNPLPSVSIHSNHAGGLYRTDAPPHTHLGRYSV